MTKKRHQTEEYKQYQKDYRKKNKEKQKSYMKEYYKNNKETLNAKNKSRYLKNKEKAKEYSKKYRRENKEVLKKKKQKYYQNNKEKINEKRKDIINSSEINKVKERVRCLIKNYFRIRGHSKKSKTYEIVGCTGDELYLHLIETFVNRYGIEWDDSYLQKVHVDHIKPVSLAESLEDFVKLNHYTNLQFLWAIDNMKKGNKYEEK